MKLLLVTVSIIAVLTVDGRNSPDDYGALDSAPVDTEGYNTAEVDPEATFPIQDPISKNNAHHFYSNQTADIIPCKADTLDQMLQTMQANLKTKINMEIQAFKVKLTNTSFYNVSNRECPEGFFNTTGSSQCYKFYDYTRRNYANCKKKCEADGLVLPEPTNPITLRKYLVETYETHHVSPNVYLGARGTGYDIRWERSGRLISNTDALWYRNNPGTSVSSRYCLVLLANKSVMDRLPNQTYAFYSGAYGRPTLCEYSLEFKIDQMLQTMQANLNTKINMEIQALKVKLTNTSFCNNRGCPEGFFQTAGSNQCYKYYNDTTRSYSDGKEMCQGEGLVLAEPTNPISLRKYLVETYGTAKYVFLGAHGRGSNLQWDRSGRWISNTDALWTTRMPEHRVTTRYCLVLSVNKNSMDSQPNQPYFSSSCNYRYRRYTLCEYVQ